MANSYRMLDNEGYRHALRIRNLLLFHRHNGWTKVLQCHVSMYISCLVVIYVKFGYLHVLLYPGYHNRYSD